MKKYLVLKLIGLAVMVMAILVLLSFSEVAVYSYLVNPGQEEGVYEAHAEDSAPYISGIFGSIIFFLIVRYWKRRAFENTARLWWQFPLTYILLDLIILFAAGVDWSEFFLIFLLANVAKFLGSFLGYKITPPLVQANPA